jgi:hypothetical protein
MNVSIQFPNVSSFKDWEDADPQVIKDVFEKKILDVMKLLARENKMSEVVKI